MHDGRRLVGLFANERRCTLLGSRQNQSEGNETFEEQVGFTINTVFNIGA